MRRYSVFIHEGVLSSAPKAGVQHRLVMDFIRSLAEDPYHEGDFAD